MGDWRRVAVPPRPWAVGGRWVGMEGRRRKEKVDAESRRRGVRKNSAVGLLLHEEESSHEQELDLDDGRALGRPFQQHLRLTLSTTSTPRQLAWPTWWLVVWSNGPGPVW
jgi:hypothetical protein